MPQPSSNPFPYSSTNKRYLTYDHYMKLRFGGKAAKIPLDAHLTCPNIDGTRSRGGCTYCLRGSSSAVGQTLREQYESGAAVMSRKWSLVGYIPYLQSNSNTYADTDTLRRIYTEVSGFDGALMLDIATRADCLGDDVVSLLEETAHRIPLTVELGLQSSCDATAERVNRGHSYAEFLSGYARLREAADRVNSAYPSPEFYLKRFSIGIHLINGLPGEDTDAMLNSARDVASLKPELVKLHLLHVLRGTPIGDDYLSGSYAPMSLEDYVSVVVSQLELLPPETIIGRVTGDGIPSALLAPLWSLRKISVLNEIDKSLYRLATWQGRLADME